MDIIAVCIIISMIALTGLIYYFYKENPNKYKDNTTIKSDLKNEAIQSDNNYLLYKYDILEKKLDRNHNTMVFIIFLVLLCTGLIIYLLYTWTYYIQPNTINNLIGNMKSLY